MTDSIADLLPTGRFKQPPEVQIIKDFVQKQFQQPVQVTIQPALIIIQVKSAALAGALRPQLHQLQDLCQTDKRLIIRIG
jgi:hypothetical protein